MKKNFKLLSFLLTAVLLLSTLTIFVHSTIISETETSWREKIYSDLWEVMESSSYDDLISVWLWIQDVDYGIIESAMTEKGMNPSVFENTQRFNEEIVPEVVQQVEETIAHATQFNINDHFDINDEIYDEENHFDNLLHTALHELADTYIREKRRVIRETYETNNGAFIERYANHEYEQRILHKSTYAPFIIINLTKDEIIEHAMNSKVTAILPVAERERFIQPPSLSSNDFLSRIFADGVTGTKSNLFNNNSGFRGTNVSVAIIEQNEIIASSSAPQLARAYSEGRLEFVIPPGVTPLPPAQQHVGWRYHGCMTTSLLGGDAVTLNGVIYEGVVPNAKLYMMPFEQFDEPSLMTGIQMLLDRDVSVINASVDIGFDVEYDTLEQALDAVLYRASAVFIVSAGNNNSGNPGSWRVGTPGKALNVITVGNADVVSRTTPPFNMHSSSSHIISSFLPNKPDIAAPGEGAPWVNHGNRLGSTGGTSAAAPIASGIVAQMMEANPELRFNPRAAKARLVLAADDSRIAPHSNNPIAFDSEHLRERSGAGLVDAARSVNATQHATSIDFKIRSSGQQNSDPIFFFAGQRIRAVMVYDKRHTNMIISQNDMDVVDFYLRRVGSIEPIRSITSNRNNVRIIDFTVPANGTGYYYFAVNPRHLVNSAAGVNVNISFLTNDLEITFPSLSFNGTNFQFTHANLFDRMLTRRGTSVGLSVVRQEPDTMVSWWGPTSINNAGFGAGSVNHSNLRSFTRDDYVRIGADVGVNFIHPAVFEF